MTINGSLFSLKNHTGTLLWGLSEFLVENFPNRDSHENILSELNSTLMQNILNDRKRKNAATLVTISYTSSDVFPSSRWSVYKIEGIYILFY